MYWLAQLEIIGEVILAIALGGAIGIEREIANKPAGFRTNMLVAGAAALAFVGVNRLKRVDPAPRETIRTLKENQLWLREQMSR